MSGKGRIKGVRWVRRGVQAFSLLMFVVLLLAARHPGKGHAPSPWLEFFFAIDPLVMLATALATHTVPALLLLSLMTLVVTVLLGRVFCGWVCPFGTINAMVSALRRPDNHTLVRTESFTPWQRGKYFLLTGLLVASLFGAHLAGILDPFSLLYKAAATGLLPAVQYGVEESANAVYQADPHVGPLHATSVTEPVYHLLRDDVFVAKRQTFSAGLAILGFFALVVSLNLFRKRFWCRYLCPLGALLGLFAKRPVLRLVKDSDQCTHCGLCKVNCQGAATPDEPGEWQPSECFMCMNCAAKCNWGAVDFAFGSPLKRPSDAGLDLSKRALLASGTAGLGAMLALRITPEAQAKIFNPGLVRPPGARAERDFLHRCVQCGICMKACPTNGLQPTLLEAGFEGLWTPRLVAQIGYCEYECNLCGQLCPTEAIQPLAIKDKQAVKMGLATFDTTRCLPYAYERECMICEEHCPVPTKAIHFIETDVVTRTGAVKRLKQPRVDPDLCIGCGICENKCVFRDRPAIRVTSANETRHSANQPILPSLPGLEPAPPPASADPYG